MRLDLMELKTMHPLLPLSTAIEYGHRAAVGLGRHRHEPGVALATLNEAEVGEASLHWVIAPPGDLEQLDSLQITEDTAEAIALALVSIARGWVVRRRLQRGEFADWLLQDSESDLVALEISGVGDGVDPSRLSKKLQQVRRVTITNQRVACVVELEAPRATVATA